MSTTIDLSPLRVEHSPSASGREVSQADLTFAPSVRAMAYPTTTSGQGGGVGGGGGHLHSSHPGGSEPLTHGSSKYDQTHEVMTHREPSQPNAGYSRSSSPAPGSNYRAASPGPAKDQHRKSPVMCNGSIPTAPTSLSADRHHRKPSGMLVYEERAYNNSSPLSSSSSSSVFRGHEDEAPSISIPKERTIGNNASPAPNAKLNTLDLSPRHVRHEDDEYEIDGEDEEMRVDGRDNNVKDDDVMEVVDEEYDEDEDEDNEVRVGSDREEDDQIECAECSLVFSNLQHYMDHTCQRASSRHLMGGQSGRRLSSTHDDAEDGSDHHLASRPISTRVECALIYDLEDNLYVVEGQDWRKTLDQRELRLHDDALIIRGDQAALNLDRALPSVSRVVFVPFAGPASSSRLFNFSNNAKAAATAFISASDSAGLKKPAPVLSCLLHDLRSSRPDHLVKLAVASPSLSTSLSSHIRLCCVCKAVYNSSKAFLHHAIVEHSIDVSHLDHIVLESPHTGGIIHRAGATKSVTVAFLSPDPKYDSPSPRQMTTANNLHTSPWDSSDKVHRRLSEMAFFGRHGHYMNGTTPLVRDRDMSRLLSKNSQSNKAAGLPYEDGIPHPSRHHSDSSSMTNLTFDPASMRTSLPALARASLNPEAFYKGLMPPLVTVADKFSSALHKSSPGEQQSGHESSLIPRSSPVPLSPKKLPLSSSTSSSSSSSSLPPLMALSSASATSAYQGLPVSSMSSVGSVAPLTSSSSSSIPTSNPLTMHLPSFLGSCDEHPQGRALGVDCAKCDMVLPPPHSLGNQHMNMSHSRNSCKTLKCPKCNWHYKYQETLEIHMKEKHPDSDAQCVYCLTNQPHPRLARGESYSCGYKPYRCEVCNYSTTTKGNLSIHMQSDKHINNMQDLANGNGELKMQPQPSQQPQTLPPSSSSAITTNPPVFTAQDDAAHFKKATKQKQSFRCDVCSYETSVARNLRIHMTSEKHTHNMLVMSQSLNHLHQDMTTLHQMSHMNQLLALSQQDSQAARYASVLGSHFPTAGMFPYDQAAMIMSASGGGNPPAGFELPINLTKENSLDEWIEGGLQQDASKMFQCCICNKYGSDSVENVHNHIQFDRTKGGNSDAFVTFAHGTYHCNLCTYKTHLKANFQLHCKTDKHLQKLQTVLHMQEGGPENDWRLVAQQTNAVATFQICCNACSYYANSTHKMQLHLSSMQHDACAQLFRHLQVLDRTLPAPPSGRQRYYHCSLCPANLRTKQKLVLHSRSARHLRAEHNASQRPMSILDVFPLKDLGDGDQVDFEDSATSRSPERIPEGVDAGTISAPTKSNNGSQLLVAGGPVSLGGNQVANGLNPTPYHNPHGQVWSDDLLTGPTPSASNTEHALNFPKSAILANNRPLGLNTTATTTTATNGHSNGRSISPNNYQHYSSAAKVPACILCPLCRHECPDRPSLELHLSRKHNVAPEGLSKLMLVVDWPANSSSNSVAMDTATTEPPIPAPSSSSSSVSVTNSQQPPPPSSSSSPPPLSESSSSAMQQQHLGRSLSSSPSQFPSQPVSSTPSSSLPSSSSSLSFTAASTVGNTSKIAQGSGSLENNHGALPTSPPTAQHCENNQGDGDDDGEAEVTTSSKQAAATFGLTATPATFSSSPAAALLSSSPSATSSTPCPDPSSLSTIASLSSSTALSSSLSSSASLSSSSLSSATKPQGLYHNTLTVTATATTPTSAMVTTGSKLLDTNVTRSRSPWRESRSRPAGDTPEINPDLLEKEHQRLLKEGVDMSLQDIEELYRCQTCSQSFSGIDQMYAHQNELGHLELKQTPRGPGYLCWKKGCNQYFKTASALQMHFKEIHVKKASMAVLPAEELELYAFKCEQCTYGFRSEGDLQRHVLLHLAISVTRCRICSKGFSSVEKLKKHLDAGHLDLSPSEVSAQIDILEMNEIIVKKSPCFASFTSEFCIVNGTADSDHHGNHDMDIDVDEPRSHAIGDNTNAGYEGESMDKQSERQFLEEYINSPALAEANYLDPNRKYKCFTCRMAFTKQSFLISHNSTTQHQEKVYVSREKSLTSSSMPAHFTHSGKSQGHRGGMTEPIQSHTGCVSMPSSEPSPNSVSLSTKSLTNGNHNHNQPSEASSGSSSGNSKPFKCNICQVSYLHAPGLEIHMRSVAHKTVVNRLGELIQAGQIDPTSTLIEHPDPKVIGKQQAQLIADLIHQQASAQAASNALYSLQGLPNLNAMAQMSMLQGALTSSSHMMNAQNSLAAYSASQMASQIEAYESQLRNSSMLSHEKDLKDNITSQSTYGDEIANSMAKMNAKPDLTEKVINMVIKQDGRIEPVESRMKQLHNDMKLIKKEDEPLPPNFPHAPVLTRPRGFMGRFKPQLHRSLLENFGFECVMHFNEENSNTKKVEGPVEEPTENDEDEQVIVKEEVEEENKKGEEEMPETLEVEEKEEEKKEEEKKEEHEDSEVPNEEESKDKEEENKDDKKDENKENIDLPELNKTKCSSCSKFFSSVWVLKNHEEEVHSNFVSPDDIEVFGTKFREEWEKALPKTTETQDVPTVPPPTTSVSNPSTPTVEKTQSSDMPPPPPPSQPQMPTTMDMAQLLPLMGMNLLPMHLPMSLVNLGLQTSLMPSLMMPPSLDMSQAFMSQMPPPLVDSSGNANSQQQLKAAAAAAAAAAQAQNQKRVRTRISDDQLKVLRQYFDINNSPSEDQINKMADQTGLPQKVIKHWFRNTLFKERQRNKDSPYNFNNPPSTSIDLDEYDRTGKIPEVKVEPEEEEEESSSASIPVEKKEVIKEEAVLPSHYEKDIHVQDLDPLSSVPLKIDLTPRMDMMNEDSKRDNDSYSNTSSPSNVSSMPSTPTASAPSTPTPVLNSAHLSANPLAFSLDAYAANIARMEAASFQSIGKRANRTRFTDFQIKTLQDYFERNAYPKDDELEHLSKRLGLSARVIVVWFQNARQKARKIYENHPSSEPAATVACPTKESTSPFQRTPGLNYQCKKCHAVFQRYYELIKHQKNCCFGESNNNTKSIPSVTDEDDSNSRNSLEESSSGALSEKQRMMYIREQEIMARMYAHSDPTPPPSMTSNAAKLSTPSAVTASTTPAAGISSSQAPPSFPPSTSSSSLPTPATPNFQCDKCSLTFSRFDTFQDHQKAHNIAPAMFTPFSSSSAFGMLQTLAHQEDTTSKAALPSTARTSTSPGATHPSLPSTPVPAAHQNQGQSNQSLMSTSLPSVMLATSPSPSSKRKTDSEDESGEQPRDKRLRTTILPEQLDYLYQQYQIDCNPSRKQLEHIANTVNLKKRVVQVWFQNTRARERKGHYRAHQQLINKRCPFCRALFRAKSALESHLATKHPEEMAKGDINIDLIPDAVLEISQSSHNKMTNSSSLPPQMNSSDLSKLLPSSATSQTMPNYMALMQSAASLNFPFSADSVGGHSSFEDPFFKKYMSELAHNAACKDHHLSLPPTHNKTPSHGTMLNVSAPHKPTAASPSPAPFPSPRPLDAHAHKPKAQSSSLPSPAVAPSGAASNDDAPLDLSKPMKPSSTPVAAAPENVAISSKILPTTAAELMERSIESDYLRRMSNLEDSFSETYSEVADQDYMNEDGNSSPSPSRSGNGSISGTPGGGTPNSYSNAPGSGKRYRTQMSATQVKVMKHLFMDYKTPTMAECELLGQEIGLAKRVVQVWFQNARAKEKKAKLSSGKPFNPELDFPKSPEECKLCNYKYSHKVTVQDHIFTKAHIDRVKKSLRREGELDFDYPTTPAPATTTPRPPSQEDLGRKQWDSALTTAHLAQLQALGMNPSAMALSGLGGVEYIKSQEMAAATDPTKKDKKPSEGGSSVVGVPTSKEQHHAMEIAAMNAHVTSAALSNYMPSLDPGYLSYMYSSLPGYFPAMGLPMLQPGILPSVDPMMNFDPLSFGTPLAFLQIPSAAINSVSEKLLEPGSILARYTQDCQALADLHSQVSAADLTVAAEATLDVGYICKKCQMVYPAKDTCMAHQRTGCLATSAAAALPKGFEPIIKLEQVQYECRACNERFSTIAEFKGHCQQDTHRAWLMKFKSRGGSGDAPPSSRQEATRGVSIGGGDPSSPPSVYMPVSYASSAPPSCVVPSSSPLPSYAPTSNKPSGSPTNTNNNNNNNTCNNNTGGGGGGGHHISKSLSPTPAHQLSKMINNSSLFRDKANGHLSGHSMPDLQRLKAE